MFCRTEFAVCWLQVCFRVSFSASVKLLPPVRMNSRPSTPPLCPRTMSQPLTFENVQRGDRLHCVFISARKKKKKNDWWPTSATMHIIISMFDLSAEIILNTPVPPPKNAKYFTGSSLKEDWTPVSLVQSRSESAPMAGLRRPDSWGTF